MSQASFELRESRWSEGLDTYAPTIQAFADHLAGLDYRAYTVMRLASAARHFCVWLQLSKVAPDEIDDDVVTRFTRHRCCCLERLWRSVKYEEVYLRAYDSVSDARASLGRYLEFYNSRRPHSSLGARTPEQAYLDHLPQRMAA